MKRAFVPLAGLTVLCSLAGCGGRQAQTVPVPPVILNLPDCPAPERPLLPPVNGEAPFDAPVNVKAFLERDDIMRAYIKGLEAALACSRRNTKQGEPE